MHLIIRKLNVAKTKRNAAHMIYLTTNNKSDNFKTEAYLNIGSAPL